MAVTMKHAVGVAILGVGVAVAFSLVGVVVVMFMIVFSGGDVFVDVVWIMVVFRIFDRRISQGRHRGEKTAGTQ